MKNITSWIVFLILSFLFVLSIFIVVKFSNLPPLEFLPDFIKNALQSPQIGTLKYEMYRLLENLSLAFITAYLIYLIIDFIPNYIAKKKAFLIYKSMLVNIYMNMSGIIGTLKMLANVHKEDRKLKVDDFKDLNYYKTEYKRVYYKSYVQINGKKNNNFTKGVFNFHQSLSDAAKTISKNIEKIIKPPIATKLDYNFLELLSSIESSSFLIYCKQLSESPLQDKEYTSDAFAQNLYDFVQLQLQLKKYNFNKHSYKFEKLGNEDILELDQTRQRMMQNIDCQDAKFYHGSIEYIIKDDKLN